MFDPLISNLNCSSDMNFFVVVRQYFVTWTVGGLFVPLSVGLNFKVLSLFLFLLFQIMFRNITLNMYW